MTRFVLEGTWTGYTSSQSRVCHREVVSSKRATRLREMHKIVFTDGTSLLLHVREAGLREKIVPKNMYGDLIRDAEKHGGSVVRVADLCEEVSQ